MYLDNYEILGEALYKTTFKMPTTNITADSYEIKESLLTTESILNEIPNVNVILDVSNNIHNMDLLVQEEYSELVKCKQLLSTFSTLSNQHQSLLVQQIQHKK